jgi:hypothetical protein
MFKIVNKLEKVNFVNGINYGRNAKLETRRYDLRSHTKTIHRDKSGHCRPRFNFFTNRVASMWNKLPDDVVNAKSLNSFKAKIDVWLKTNQEPTATAY